MEWKISQKPVDYKEAVAAMEERVAAILAGKKPEMVWLLEHPPLYTAGTSAKASGLLDNSRFPVYQTGRGGEYTYHGPGQRIAYVMLDLRKPEKQDLKRYVCNLEKWIIATLKEFGVEGFTREGRVGVWVNTSSPRLRGELEGGGNNKPPSPNPSRKREGNSEAKIAAIGIRVRKWITFHGISLNVNPDLSHYAGIVPCGITGFGVTSLKAVGVNASMQDVDEVLKKKFEKILTLSSPACPGI